MAIRRDWVGHNAFDPLDGIVPPSSSTPAFVEHNPIPNRLDSNAQVGAAGELISLARNVRIASVARLDKDRFGHGRMLSQQSKERQHRIVLIDGQELARLLIRYGVGVRSRTTFVVSGIDEDYFSEA